MPGRPLQPLLPISFVSAEGVRLPPVPAIVDSGADSSVLPEHWAPRLGFRLDECEEHGCFTASGATTFLVAEPSVVAFLGEDEVRLSAKFSKTRVPLLGRSDFFSQYDVRIDERAREVVLRRYSDPLGSAG